jgi:hypothetical protein
MADASSVSDPVKAGCHCRRSFEHGVTFSTSVGCDVECQVLGLATVKKELASLRRSATLSYRAKVARTEDARTEISAAATLST